MGYPIADSIIILSTMNVSNWQTTVFYKIAIAILDNLTENGQKPAYPAKAG